MKVLVCGGRDYTDWHRIGAELTALREREHFTILIHGDSRGADQIAGVWAKGNGVQEVRCPANWDVWGRAAGPIRNNCMLELNPDLVVAFPGGNGTRHMTDAAERAGIRVLRIT